MASSTAMAVVLACTMGTAIASISHSDTFPGYLAKIGYAVEEHFVTTDDGYILGMFRLPRESAPAVLFQHGILDSSWTWVVNEPSLAPAIQAYEMGYDVWLSNNRGNVFSRQHVSLSPSSKAFWDFSFADMGRHDVPANVEYVLSRTGNANLTYVGHSQGTSQFFSMMTDAPLQASLKEKVNLFVAVAPVTYLTHQTSLLVSILSDGEVGPIVEATYPYGFLTWSSLSGMANLLCKVTGGLLCKLGVEAICGTSSLDPSGTLDDFIAHFPAGASVKCMNHYSQLHNEGGFRDYDYGMIGNLRIYGTSSPPDFDLSKAEIPTALLIGENDALGDPVDAGRALEELPQSTVVFHEVFKGFSHVTWLAGTEGAFQSWFPKFQMLLAQHNPLPKSTVAV